MFAVEAFPAVVGLYQHVLRRLILTNAPICDATYQDVVKALTTLSPFWNFVTASPVSTTTPVNSWPMINPEPEGSMPRYV